MQKSQDFQRQEKNGFTHKSPSSSGVTAVWTSRWNRSSPSGTLGGCGGGGGAENKTINLMFRKPAEENQKYTRRFSANSV